MPMGADHQPAKRERGKVQMGCFRSLLSEAVKEKDPRKNWSNLAT